MNDTERPDPSFDEIARLNDENRAYERRVRELEADAEAADEERKAYEDLSRKLDLQLAEAEEIELQLAKQFEDASKRAEQANRDLATAQAQIAQLMKAMRDLMAAVTPALQKSFPKSTWAKQWEKAEQILAEPLSGETK